MEGGFNLEAAFNSIGLSLYTDEWSCKVLAFAFCYGSECEAVVLNPALNFAIQTAQQKLNIKGEEQPDIQRAPMLMKYIQELRKQGKETPWLKDIYKRYGFKFEDENPGK